MLSTRSPVCCHQQRSFTRRSTITFRRARTVTVRRAIEEKRDTANSAGESTPDVLSKEQLSKLAELRRQSKQLPEPSSNPIQGALDEAQLITWPTPQKALLDTVLVLAIVSASGALLLGVNILLADLSTAWYSK